MVKVFPPSSDIPRPPVILFGQVIISLTDPRLLALNQSDTAKFPERLGVLILI
jgi:hypothetical protein